LCRFPGRENKNGIAPQVKEIIPKQHQPLIAQADIKRAKVF
jgi:hypothetical protein